MAGLASERLTDELPAVAGGAPVFAERLPLVRTSIPDIDAVLLRIRRTLEAGTLTNGPLVRELEARAADYLGVDHCVAVASCTAGLMLVLRVAGLSGEVILPSFTFSATAHALAWNGLCPAFADVDDATLTLSPDDTRRVATAGPTAILATHLYGTPCDVEGLGDVAREHGMRLFFDAAHAFGSKHAGKPVGGFGDAEIFSLSPTKILVAGEGGLIATNDDMLAERCRIGRDYGNPGDYDCRFVGLNARMSEFHAALALESLVNIDDRIDRRNELAGRYKGALGTIPGISFPEVRAGDRSTFKDFSVMIDPGAFGIDATRLANALAAEGIETRRYYAPPVHRMQAYRDLPGADRRLPVTERAAERILTLPMWSTMTEDQIAHVVQAIGRLAAFLRRHGGGIPNGRVNGGRTVGSRLR
jgi:dTDP-4-amino-4,6-dideoxygalactose transaminase